MTGREDPAREAREDAEWRSIVENFGDRAELPDPAPDAVGQLLAAEDAHRLHHCLETLESNQRDAIRTAFFDGVTYADLAARRSVPLGTMKSWVRRGLARLKACLEP